MTPRRLRVLALFDAAGPLARGHDLRAELATPDWKTEAHVLQALRALGHTVDPVVVFDRLEPLLDRLASFRPDVVFNLADQFRNNRAFDQNIAAVLELQGVPFTGCGSATLAVCKHKALSKDVVARLGVAVPRSCVVLRGRRAPSDSALPFPMLVKPLREEASLGIAQASLVRSPAALRARVRHIHRAYDHDAIAEEYIDGRELYVSVIGGRLPQVLPIRELVFGRCPPGAPRIATFRAKWDEGYRRRRGLRNRFADDLAPGLVRRVRALARLIHERLGLDGYARLDLRLTPAGELFFIEANPNPMLAADEDFAQSALRAGIRYPALVERILRLALATRRE